MIRRRSALLKDRWGQGLQDLRGNPCKFFHWIALDIRAGLTGTRSVLRAPFTVQGWFQDMTILDKSLKSLILFLQKWREGRKTALRKAASGIERRCREKYPDIVGNAKIVKWRAACYREGWRDLPEIARARSVATKNAWRSRMNLPIKGRRLGGQVPWPLQKELDLLMVEFTSGASNISERKEFVTTEQVAAWTIIFVKRVLAKCHSNNGKGIPYLRGRGATGWTERHAGRLRPPASGAFVAS